MVDDGYQNGGWRILQLHIRSWIALGVMPASTLSGPPNAAQTFTPVLCLIVISEPGTYGIP